jgi:hypothetical protein
MMAQAKTQPAEGDQSLGDLVALATRDLSQLVRCEIELAKMEMRRDLRRAGVAGALLGIAAFVACLMLVMLCFAFAYGLMTVGAPSWAAFLAVAAACVLLALTAAGIAFLGMRSLSRLRKTRESVRGSVALLRRGTERPGSAPQGAGPAPQGATLATQQAAALPGQSTGTR